MMPKKAMVLAAGKGTRMRAYNDRIPKPLVQVAGKCLIDYALDLLAASGVEEAVVNTSYLASLIEAHLKSRRAPRITISREEPEPLETGGGIAKALSLLDATPFFALNSDVIVRDGKESTLRRLASRWKDGMDALLLLIPVEKAVGYSGPGDFFLEADGFLRRKREDEQAPYVFGGAQILHPRLFEAPPPGAFSLNVLYDRSRNAEGKLQRVAGVVHTGEWLHVGDKEGVHLANEKLS